MTPTRPDVQPPSTPTWRVVVAVIAAPVLALALSGLATLSNGPFWANALIDTVCFLAATFIAYRIGGSRSAPGIAAGMSIIGSIALLIVLVGRHVGSAEVWALCTSLACVALVLRLGRQRVRRGPPIYPAERE